MIVTDASVIVELLLRTGAAEAIGARIFTPRESLHAPHLLDVEVAHVLRRYARLGQISAARGDLGLDLLTRMPLRRYRHDVLLARIWALRETVSACDAAYVALAEALDAPLLTRDHRLASTSGHGARIELI